MKLLCECGRIAVTRINGRVKVSKDHDLCFRCFRAERDRQASARMNMEDDDSDRYEYETGNRL